MAHFGTIFRNYYGLSSTLFQTNSNMFMIFTSFWTTLPLAPNYCKGGWKLPKTCIISWYLVRNSGHPQLVEYWTLLAVLLHKVRSTVRATTTKSRNSGRSIVSHQAPDFFILKWIIGKLARRSITNWSYVVARWTWHYKMYGKCIQALFPIETQMYYLWPSWILPCISKAKLTKNQTLINTVTMLWIAAVWPYLVGITKLRCHIYNT